MEFIPLKKKVKKPKTKLKKTLDKDKNFSENVGGKRSKNKPRGLSSIKSKSTQNDSELLQEDKICLNKGEISKEKKETQAISFLKGSEENTEDRMRLRGLIHRRKELEEKNKKRLFIKLNKKIKNESQIKELHGDIRRVVFPRKKNPRWCWAVFASEAKADEALEDLLKIKGIVVTKPNPREMVEMKREKKLMEIQRKNEASIKLKEIWL